MGFTLDRRPLAGTTPSLTLPRLRGRVREGAGGTPAVLSGIRSGQESAGFQVVAGDRAGLFAGHRDAPVELLQRRQR